MLVSLPSLSNIAGNNMAQQINEEPFTYIEPFFASGYETYNIFEFALERNHINKSKLLRYASRRNRKDKVEQILIEIEHEL